MYNLKFDLAVLSAMLEDFEAFVKSDVVFWQLTNPGQILERFPKFTVGGLLFTRRRVLQLQDSFPAHDQSLAGQLLAELESKIDSWRANLERKGLAEINARINSWAWFLEECDENPVTCKQNYAGDAYARTYLKLLFDLLADKSEIESVQRRTSALDARLRQHFSVGEFVWDESVRKAFPADEFWFLHGFPDF